MSETAIVCSNLSFSWPGETPLFEELSFTVGDGHTGLVAPNGAGKSTLLKLIAGEYRPSAGSVTVDGSRRLSAADACRSTPSAQWPTCSASHPSSMR